MAPLELDIISIGAVTLAVVPEQGARLSSEDDALEVIGATYGSGVDWIVIPVARLAPEFFDLSIRKAGLFLQKLVNYQFRVAILGDISEWTSRSAALGDFVREANRGGQIRFAPDLDRLGEMLANQP